MTDAKRYVEWKQGLELKIPGYQYASAIPDSEDLVNLFEQVTKLEAIEAILIDGSDDAKADLAVIKGIMFAGEEGMAWRQ